MTVGRSERQRACSSRRRRRSSRRAVRQCRASMHVLVRSAVSTASARARRSGCSRPLLTSERSYRSARRASHGLRCRSARGTPRSPRSCGLSCTTGSWRTLASLPRRSRTTRCSCAMS
eukprot:7389665-Prymnesium_polylepis.1